MSRFNFCVPALWLFVSCALASLQQGETRSVYTFGMRAYGDQLLVRDMLEAKQYSSYESPEIIFNYIVSEQITCIIIESDENVQAEVQFSYHQDLIKGTVTASNSTADFSIAISIYGFNDTMLNVDPSVVINREMTASNGTLEPEYYETEAELLNEEEFPVEDEVEETVEPDDESSHYYVDEDKVIEIGERQNGDSLLYDILHATDKASIKPRDQSLVFYYIDSNFITYVQFVVYGHYTEKSIESKDYRPPVAEFSHISPNTLKAVITDYNVTSLLVHMFVYGYRAADVNKKYVPFLQTSQQQVAFASDNAEADTLSQFAQRLKSHMKSEAYESNLDLREEQTFGEDTIILGNEERSAPSAAISIATLRSRQANAVILLLLLVCASLLLI